MHLTLIEDTMDIIRAWDLYWEFNKKDYFKLMCIKCSSEKIADLQELILQKEGINWLNE